jgi:hypothetical protein
MNKWTPLRQTAALRVMIELAKLDPHNVALAFARSIFADADAEGHHPIQRRVTAASLKRQRMAERAAERARLDNEMATYYRAGFTLMATAEKFGVGQTRVSDALARLAVNPRKQGAAKGTGEDLERVERIRKARSVSPPMTLDEIARHELISRERVRQICLRHGIGTGKINQGDHTEEVLRKAHRIAELYRANLPISRIADEVGLPKPGAVYRYLYILGVEPNRAKAA